MKEFLPVIVEDIAERSWEQMDFLFVSGDAYVDHPSFGPAVICRVLESKWYKVALLCQPQLDKPENFAVLEKLRLGVLVSGGNIDSMLCHYTTAKKLRIKDKYTPSGTMRKRTDHAVTVYAKQIKKLWPDLPVIIGGIEVSLRRFVHFNYWEDKLLSSVLESSGADILIYGMGEKQIVEVADYLPGGVSINDMFYIRSTEYASPEKPVLGDYVELPSFMEIKADRELFVNAYQLQSREQDPFYGKPVIQKGESKYIIQNPATYPLT